MLNQFFVTDTKPEVGMDATVLYVTDRVSTKIVGVPNARTVEVWDGERVVGWTMPEDGGELFYDETPLLSVYTLRKNGRWVAKGQPLRGGTALLVGVKDDYRDPSF